VSALALSSAAAVTLAVLLLANLFGPGRGPGSVPSQASPSPTTPPAGPSLTLGPSLGTLSAGGLDAPALAAGSWQTLAFEPRLTFTVPPGLWSPGLDLPQQLFLRAHLPGAPADEVDAVTIVRLNRVFSDPCGRGEAGPVRAWTEPPGGGAFFDWLARESPLELGPVGTVDVLGRPARQIELLMPEGAFASCADGRLPIAEVSGGPSEVLSLPQVGQRFRLAALELDGGTYLGLTFATPSRWGALVAATDQLLGTFEFP